ncbi:MAG: ABC transporter ATP-binding protein, partial [Bacteroidales bacterium]
PSKSIFRKVMAMAADETRLVVISTHQVRDLHSLIDAVVIVDGGKILLNADADTITEKLAFQQIEGEINKENVLYKEESVRGFLVVSENTDHLETKLDIELLFNATMMNKERISQIFTFKNKNR